ncbi:phage GP46 family protein [Pseudomonas sichuanensis]|uniref:phage GP46 family protein n=1 Tax=Pseudomonas sichuanensis TaxID=2213015 RepID=UPI002448BD43|nr:phage GP46 family protein [Pseudomonas sichuanensis]MDH0730986.1 phage GP46 family protein [Pseudomonas sichuanensis]MDH1581037.1 phage GP46 family protein [Pseudomonas sichuanensis]MDH1591102.1 phage GP46 family protein [Pseudomonas sichuanensis]MDH1596771.1 phage GP46 family protein [Pseudomonas sichuanensis]
MTLAESDKSLVRTVVISLFTWRRAGPDDPVDDEERYGWWGDSFPRVADDRIGSRLWLLRRVKLTERTQRDAEYYAEEALRWLVEDGQVLGVAITSERADSTRLNLRVVLTLLSGAPLIIDSDQLWQVTYAV